MPVMPFPPPVKPPRNHPVDVGMRSEAAILLRFIELGYDVLVPHGVNHRYDFVLDQGDRFLRIQCKTGRLRNGTVQFSPTSVRSNTKGGARAVVRRRGRLLRRLLPARTMACTWSRAMRRRAAITRCDLRPTANNQRHADPVGGRLRAGEAGEGTRTPGPRLTRTPLYQLSYSGGVLTSVGPGGARRYLHREAARASGDAAVGEAHRARRARRGARRGGSPTARTAGQRAAPERDRVADRRAAGRGALPRAARARVRLGHRRGQRPLRRRRRRRTTRRRSASSPAPSSTRSPRGAAPRSSRASGARRSPCGEHGRETTMAVDVLAHESWHLQRDHRRGRRRSAARCRRWRGRRSSSARRAEQGHAMARAQFDGDVPARCPAQYRAAAARTAGRSTCARTTSASRRRLLVHAVAGAAGADLLAPPRDGVGQRASRAGSPAPSPSRRAAAPRCPRTSITSCARTSDGSTTWSISAPATQAERRDQLARGRRAARADVDRPRLARGRQQPVGAHDVAHVGVVAPRVRVAGHDADRVVARLEPGRDLARERRERVERRLARSRVVERRAGARRAGRARRRRSRRAGRRPPSRPRTGSAGAAAPTRRRAARPAGRRPRRRRPRRRTRSGASCRTASSTLSVIAWLRASVAPGSRPRAADVRERGEVVDDLGRRGGDRGARRVRVDAGRRRRRPPRRRSA